jgi:hypothetical protein
VPESMKPIIEPTVIEMVKAFGRDLESSIRCVSVGRIEKFDVTKKTAEVHILIKRTLPDGTTSSYPPLLDVPVVTIQGGGTFLQMPITAGDNCLLFFADRNIDAWFKTGAESIPYDARCHSLSDAIALVGLDSLASSQPDYPTDEVRLAAATAKVAVKKDGSAASLVQGTGEVTATGGKIRIKSSATDLLTALNGLIDAVKAVTITDPISGALPVSVASQAALEAKKAVLGGLLST